MCGVFVVFSKQGHPLPEEKCKKASFELYNRGPDFFQHSFLRKKTLYISNTVLSITGDHLKKKTISQSINKNFFISYNGEIYNYLDLCKEYLPMMKLTEKITDTTVLVNLHEKINISLIPKLLNGMFAYVVYDKKADNLSIVNDVQGEKNLYYFEDNEYFIVSSTIQPILSFNKNYSLNDDSIKNYFCSRHFMPLEDTCFKKINIFKNGIINNYSLRNNKSNSYVYDNPLNWISEKKYRHFSNMREEELINLFDYKLNQQAKIMVPKINFGCIVSGGIDSSLQAAILSQYKEPSQNLVINHGSKDSIMEHINKFNYFFKNNIIKIKLSKEKYINLSKKCYKIVSSPLQTHDLPGRLEISKYFKKNNCKVFFSADGCDELLGGQQLYYRIYNDKQYSFKLNQSPYSCLLKSNKIYPSIYYEKTLNTSWKNVLAKYQFINSNKEKNIQSSLFLDYFIQSIGVANRSNDLISCSNSVEPRNIFISKTILKFILNLPLKYKINFKEKDFNLRQKYILKKVFCKYFNSRLIFSKQGFSGFPNSLTKRKIFPLTKKIINNNSQKLYSNKNYYDVKNLNRDLNWKFINTENFLKYFFNYQVNK